MNYRRSKATKICPRYIVAAILALAGIGLLLYPIAINLLYGHRVTADKEAFLERVHTADSFGKKNHYSEGEGEVDGGDVGSGDGGDVGNGDGVGDSGDISGGISVLPDSYEELYQFLLAENDRLYKTGQDDLKDAFSYQTAGIDLSRFGLDDGCIGYLEIPSINALMPIYLGANAQNMKKGAAHMTQTSYPIGGKNTNAVLAAHRGGAREMLRNIHLIQLGDEIIITNFRERLVYRATEIKIILPTEIGEVKIREDQDIVSLITCNPLGKNIQRYVLFCMRVEE